MLVANSFDLWQRDAFFSAAEEVQESADILESAYRTWLKQKKEGIASSDLEELRRELQTALGTAKWQLEEFERAVRLSYGNCRDQNRMTRHQQFVVAIENQISRVEDSLRESLNEDGKQPLQWVNLDEDERDDLAMFLSGSCGTTKESARHESVKRCNSSDLKNLLKKKDLDNPACSNTRNMESNVQTYLRNDVVINMEPMNCNKELIAREALGARGNVNSEADQTSSAKGARFSPKSGTLRIVIPNGDDASTTFEDTPKGKGFRTSSCLYVRGTNCINMLVRTVRCSRMNGRMQSPRRLELRLLIVLMLSFFLLVPYFLQLS